MESNQDDLALQTKERVAEVAKLRRMLTMAISHLTGCPWVVCPNPTEKPCGECWWKYLEAEATAPGDS